MPGTRGIWETFPAFSLLSIQASQSTHLAAFGLTPTWQVCGGEGEPRHARQELLAGRRVADLSAGCAALLVPRIGGDEFGGSHWMAATDGSAERLFWVIPLETLLTWTMHHLV